MYEEKQDLEQEASRVCVLCTRILPTKNIPWQWRPFLLPWKKLVIFLCPQCAAGVERYGELILPKYYRSPAVELIESGSFIRG